MCGICGIYSFYGPLEQPAPVLDAALETLKKRGPEVQAHFCKGHVALGHTRLSIIDPTEAANQPFWDETQEYAIVFNGEIFNYRQLRQQLLSSGVGFRTQSDTEVLLYWLINKGAEGINELQGFFSFAFFNKRENSLLLARDRFGIKPLLYYTDGQKFLFASEMKALLKLGIPKNLDYSSLHIYFQLNYTPGPWSIYQDVLKLMPGHFILLKNGAQEIQQYYQIPGSPLAEYKEISYDEAGKLLFEKLENAVVKRLVSDVPLGAFLSGGIDSSIITALAARHVNQLKTFSIGFRDQPMFDETRYARSVAKLHKTDHTEFLLDTNDLLDCLYDVLDYIDEPFADSSALAVYILSRETKSRVTVALSGDGADEMLAGYNKHMAEWRARQGGLSANILKYLHPVFSILPKSRHTHLGNKFRQFHRFGEGMSLPPKQRYWRWAAYTDEKYPADLLIHNPDEKDYYTRKDFLTSSISGDNDFNDVLRNDMNLVLANDMLTKVDMMSMANSLEVRVPFLDHEVVNLLFSLPADYKINNNQRKRILTDTFRQILPLELHNRPKQGFEVPLLSWFRKELSGSIQKKWLNDDFIKEQGIFNPKVINKLKKQLFSPNPTEIHAQIWAIIVFQHWFEKYHA
ncbi:MAG: asparagine synthase (glutamine-hydrolyzing) [Bacteroidetes bacterium]|nr:MAG: asparagine synthase (glutamine-hydrolyzing) [Bacteroidota bacterium]